MGREQRVLLLSSDTNVRASVSTWSGVRVSSLYTNSVPSPADYVALQWCLHLLHFIILLYLRFNNVTYLCNAIILLFLGYLQHNFHRNHNVRYFISLFLVPWFNLFI